MRVSAFRGTPTRPNGHKAVELHEAASAVETTAPEPLDEQIESLLLSLDEPVLESLDEPVLAAQPEQTAAVAESRDRPRRRPARRRDPLRTRVNQFDLFFVVTAVVLGFAVGLLTVVLVNG